MKRRVLAASLLLVLCRTATAGISFLGYAPHLWGVSDATIGVTGYSIESFESKTLISGVLIGVESPAGNRAPSSTLPNLFDPFADPFGNVFYRSGTGAWDGGHGVINTRDNLSHSYNAAGNWGDLIINFNTPARSVGFSMQQMNQPAQVFVNGILAGTFDTLTGLPTNGSRQGYVRIDATGGDVITSIRLNNGRVGFNDGFMIDHLAVALVPEPEIHAMLLIGISLIGFLAWRTKWSATC